MFALVMVAWENTEPIQVVEVMQVACTITESSWINITRVISER
jgi:hypothetical protein